MAKEHLINPVQKTVCVSGDAPKDSFVAGESALSKLDSLYETRLNEFQEIQLNVHNKMKVADSEILKLNRTKLKKR